MKLKFKNQAPQAVAVGAVATPPAVRVIFGQERFTYMSAISKVKLVLRNIDIAFKFV